METMSAHLVPPSLSALLAGAAGDVLGDFAPPVAVLLLVREQQFIFLIVPSSGLQQEEAGGAR